MRVLVCTTAGTGHFGPLVPYARACSDAGHDVAVAAPGSFAPQVEAAGFAHLPFADAPADLIGEVFARLPSLGFEEANAVVVADVFGRLDARAALPAMAETVSEWRPDLVLRETSELGSLVAARVADVPQVEVTLGVQSTVDWMVPLLRAPLTELDALAGLAAGSCEEAMLSAVRLTTVPSVLDDAGPGTAPGHDGGVRRSSAPVHRFSDPSLVAEHASLPEPWGDPDASLVYVGFGTVTASAGGFEGVYPDAVAAFADRPLRVLMTTGGGLDPEDLDPLPTNVRVERWWPQRQAMPSCAASVGHGGFGTTMTALAAGVPQVVVPLFAVDQLLNAEHVQAVGAGVHVQGGPDAMTAAAEAVVRLMAEPAYRQRAGGVADAMAALPPVSAAVGLLEDLAGPDRGASMAPTP